MRSIEEETVKQAPKGKNHVARMNALKGMGTLAVVLIHAAAIGPAHSSDGFFIAFFQLISTWAVPIFLMINGATALPPQKLFSYQLNLDKMKYILSIIIVWGLIYNLASLAILERSFNVAMLWKTALMVLSGNMQFCYHFWYLYMLLGVYLVTPFIRTIIKHSTQGDLEYFIAFCLLVSGVLPFVFEVVLRSELHKEMMGFLKTFGSFILYYVLGFYLNNNHLTRRMMIMIRLGALVFFLFCLTGSLGMHSLLIGEKCKPFQMLIACLVFEMVNSRFVEHPLFKRAEPLLSSLSRYSLGIYILHPMAIIALRKVLKVDTSMAPAVISVPLVAILAIALSMAGVRVIQKIPLLKKAI